MRGARERVVRLSAFISLTTALVAGVASFLRAQGTDVWVEHVDSGAMPPQAAPIALPSATAAAMAEAAAVAGVDSLVPVGAVGVWPDEVTTKPDNVIEVSMDDLDESDVWNAMMPFYVKEEGSDNMEGDLDETDLEADIELDVETDNEAEATAEDEQSEGGQDAEHVDEQRMKVEPQEQMNTRTRMTSGRKKTRTYKCRVCGKYMGSMSRLQRHMVTHTDEERKAQPFARQCTECGRVLSSRQRLESHMQALHAVGEKKSSYVRRNLGCPVCGKVLSSQQRVRSHMATHYRNPMATATPPATPLGVAPGVLGEDGKPLPKQHA